VEKESGSPMQVEKSLEKVNEYPDKGKSPE